MSTTTSAVEKLPSESMTSFDEMLKRVVVIACTVACGTRVQSGPASMDGLSDALGTVRSATAVSGSSSDGHPLIEIELDDGSLGACDTRDDAKIANVAELDIVPVAGKRLQPSDIDIVFDALTTAAKTSSTTALASLTYRNDMGQMHTSVSGTLTLTFTSSYDLMGTLTAVMDSGETVTARFDAAACDALF